MGATIHGPEGKIKSLALRALQNRELFPALLIILVGTVSFGLGRLSVQPREDISKGQLASSVPSAPTARASTSDTKAALSLAVSAHETGEKIYVASKNSNKYHLPWCSGAARIAEENKIWFATKEAAAAAGYTPAANCKGI